MVQITGKFEHLSFSPDFEDYLKAAGSPEAFIKGVLASKPSVSIDEVGEDKWTILVHFGEKESSTTFKLGEAYDEPKPDGTVAKSVTRRDGDSLITETTLPDGRKQTKVAQYTADGFNLTLTDEKSGKKATIVFKRV